MLGPEYNWLLAPVRPAAGLRVRLARRSLLTLAVTAFCLVCAFALSAHAPVPAAALTPPAVASLDQAPVEWPRTLIHLWFLLPQLLPGGN